MNKQTANPTAALRSYLELRIAFANDGYATHAAIAAKCEAGSKDWLWANGRACQERAIAQELGVVLKMLDKEEAE